MEEQGQSGGGDLQFERAAYAQPTQARCAFCQSEIWSVYFDVNGQMACERCHSQLGELLTGGSGFGRFARATALGTVAAAAGSGLYYAVRAVSGYEFGLIAVVVGLLVGGAVRAGSQRRGGWRYQALAMFLTYAAIVSTYIPLIVQGIREAKTQETATAKPSGNGKPTGPAASATLPAAETQAPTSPSAEPFAKWPRPVVAALAFLLLFLLACAAPFLMGIQNVIGLVIIGIGLYEAWKMNRRVPLVVTGPYRVGESPPAAAVP